MNTHISKELALWLQKRGCETEVPNHYPQCYVKETGEEYWLDSIEGRDFPETYAPYQTGKKAYAYSWYDILVTHAKEFWGESLAKPTSLGFSAVQMHGGYVLEFLQKGEVKKAEAYVREHSLFAKQESK